MEKQRGGVMRIRNGLLFVLVVLSCAVPGWASITYVGSAGANSNSVTLPSHQTGDLIIILASSQDATLTIPSLPSGYNNIGSGAGSLFSASRTAYKIADSSSETSGTWSNATHIVAIVLRGAFGIGASSFSNSGGTTVSFPSLTLNVGNGTSWVVAITGHSFGTETEPTPSGMTQRATNGSPTYKVQVADTNGGVSSFSGTSISLGGNQDWQTASIEIVAGSGGGGGGSGPWTVTSNDIHNNNTGNVGIGTTTPTSKLHVSGDVAATGSIIASGNISATGNISARYQDLAEWVPARRSIAPATVVILDSHQRNTVVPSSEAYDTRVAGVVSAQPGIVLGEAGEGKVKVATTGRVKVRVDATTAPIRIGDLLVTSDREGIAMRSEPLDVGGAKVHRPGTLIGKALEPLMEGVGEILVLLSLQ